METSVAWKENTQKIFWGVIVIAVAGIFNVLYDYVSYVVYICLVATMDWGLFSLVFIHWVF